LRRQRITQALFERAMPQAKVIAVPAENIVPSAIGVCGQTVSLAPVVGIGSGDWFTHKPLQTHQHGKNHRIRHRQASVDSNA
jgi:hypothetical protein